ncbi:MAG TPA: M24 family metallopeptidase [Bacillota bacterium]|nr:M24 family metallopeptidase [Bacillota bacterium]
MNSFDFQIAVEKVEQAVKLMKKEKVDTWLILTREGSDPSVPLLLGIRSVHQAVVFINQNGKHVAITSVSDQGNYEQTGLYHMVIPYHASLEDTFLSYFEELNPKKMALNISEDDHLCDGLTLGQYMWLKNCIGREKLKEIEMSSSKILKQIRSIKSSTEMACIQKAVELTDEIYGVVHSKIRCGMTEIEIGNLFVEEMKSRNVTNGLGNPYDPPMVCIVRKGLAHRKPANYRTIPGDIVIIDFSLDYKNYKSDIARTFYFLKPDEIHPPNNIQKAFTAAIEAITASIECLVAGEKGFEVDAAGRTVIESYQYPTVQHAVGHQIGRATHDGGTILAARRTPPRPDTETPVQNGEVYAIEPTVIQDNGLPSVLVEENVLVTPSGPKILSERQMKLLTINV